MSQDSSSVSSVPVSFRTRPVWVRSARSATTFWTPVAAVGALTVLLVLLWPRNPRHAAQAHSMPEATAAYVLLEGSYLALPGNPLGNPWPGPGGSALPERDDMAALRLPLPEYTGLTGVAPWTPTRLELPSNILPDLAVRSVASVLTGLPPATNGLAITLSPGLQRAGFHFEIPPSVATNLPAVARFHVELDDKGEVIHLLTEPGDDPARARILETALNRGHGARAGSGEVLVSWGK